MIVKEQKWAEEDLVQQLKARDEKSIEYLYDNYSAALFGALLQVVEERETAEDLLQEVFVKIWNNIGSYDRSRGKLYTWMLNIARNAAIDLLRSKSYKKSSKNQSLDNSVGSLNKKFKTENNTDTIGLQTLVDKLKPEYRAMIDLLYFKGYTQSEVAEELNIPLGTVKTRSRAAILELRKAMSL